MARTGAASEGNQAETCTGHDSSTGGMVSAAETLRPQQDETAVMPEGRAAAQDQAAEQLREASGAAYLYTSMAGYFRDLDPGTYQRYRDEVLAACGGPTDPVIVMLLEQMLLAHHNIGRLQFKAATAASLEEAKVYAELAIRLMSEYRRSALALQELRAPATVKQVTVVRQQNLAGGDQQIALVEGGGKVRPRRRKTA